MTDTPRRKRKAETRRRHDAPPPPLSVAPAADDEVPKFAQLTLNKEEVHILVAAFGAAVTVASAEDENEIDKMVDIALTFVDNASPDTIDNLSLKLNRAHVAVCPTAHAV